VILNLKKPDRRRFKSRVAEKRKRERERYYSTISVLVVKIILLVFLFILLSVSYQVFHNNFPDSPPMIRYLMPVLVAIFILILCFSIVKSIREIREMAQRK